MGTGEGSLRLLGVAGYVEDGSTDPRVDWVTAFEHRTGCRVSYTQVPSANSIPAMFRLHGANYYDGVVAPPAVAGQLISAGLIAPLNAALVDGYTAISRALRTQAVTSKGRTYGIPYVWDAYVLGYANVGRAARPAHLGRLVRSRLRRQVRREDHAPGQSLHDRDGGAVPQVGSAVARHHRPV